MTTCAADAAYASEIDAGTFGEYRPGAAAAQPAFAARIETPAAGRYHLYASWASIASHQIAILRHAYGLADIVSLSYVDSLRDARGWAFRTRTGPDPINGFTLLRDAYETSSPGYTGDVRVPLLWDREAGVVLSDDTETIVADIADAFGTKPAIEIATGPAVDAEVIGSNTPSRTS